jgi:tetratricopeptide (TPR) repeat protein
VHGLLAARIDALPREEKRVLQEAAVIGRVFWEEPVTRSLGNGEVSSALLRLERRGLVFARPTSTISGQVEFMFKHALVRDVAYASLPKARRARAHAEHAAWIEELAGDRVDEFAELIAHHYLTAVAGEDADLAWADDRSGHEAIRRKAFDALLAAGNAAKKRSALQKAVELHEQAVEQASTDAQRVLALEEVGDDQTARYHGDEAVEAYRQAIALLQADLGAREFLARICSKAARMIIEKSGAWRVQPAPSEADELIRMGLEAVREPETRAWLLSLFGQSALYWRTSGGGDPVPLEERMATAERGAALAEELGTPDLLTLAARTLGELYMSEGAHRLAVEASRKQLEVADRIASRTDRALTLFEVSATLSDLASEFEPALELSRRSHEIAKSLSAHDLMHSTYGQMLALYALGRWDEVLIALEEHLSVYDQEREVLCFAVRGGPFIGALVLAHRGERERAREIATMALGDPSRGRGGLQAQFGQVLLACGDMEEGRALAEAAWAKERRSQDTVKAPWDRFILAALEARFLAEDVEALDEILPEARKLDDIPFGHAVCDRAEAVTRWKRGDREGAVRLLRTAIEEFDEIAVPFEAARARELLATVVPEESASLLPEALETYERLEARPHAERVRAKL